MGGLGLSSQPEPLPTATATAQADAVAALHKGANWLFLIAGLSLVNTVILVSGADWMFLGGLGITTIASAIAVKSGATVQLVRLFSWWHSLSICGRQGSISAWDFSPARATNGRSSPE